VDTCSHFSSTDSELISSSLVVWEDKVSRDKLGETKKERIN
jgi:hypothetical protein